MRWTIFTIPKRFTGETAALQRNALRSWRALGPDVEVIVFGDEPGVAEAAREVGARVVPEIERTELGTPLVHAAFETAADAATAPVLVYANADIVFLSDLPEALGRIRLPRFLLAGRRLDLDVGGRLSVGEAGWEERLRSDAAARGRLDSHLAIDYFAFPRGLRWEMPPLAVGRPAWDGWLIRRARELDVPVVDATASITAVHQRHGYGHVPQATGAVWEGPEAERNRELAGWESRLYSIHDATHVLTRRGLRPALGPPYLKRRLRLLGARSALVGRGLAVADAVRRR